MIVMHINTNAGPGTDTPANPDLTLLFIFNPIIQVIKHAFKQFIPILV